jgi:hypothetical protein
MMAGVDWKLAESILNGSLSRCQKAADDGVGDYDRSMGYGNVAASGVVYRDRIQVLNQGSPTPDVQGLRSEADGEQGLIEVVSVLDEKLIDVFTSRIGRVALGNGFMPELLRVYVCRRSRKKNALAGVDQVRGLAGSCVQRYLDRLTSGSVYGLSVLAPGSDVVFRIVTGGDGDGDSRSHGSRL